MAFERYVGYFYVGSDSNDRIELKTTDINEVVTWCCEMFFEHFDDSRFVGAHCLYIDTEYGPVDFTFAFHRNGSLVVDDYNDDVCFVFEDLNSGKKLVGLNDLIEWTLSIVNE